MNVLYYSFDDNKFNQISIYICIEEIWDRPEVIHEDINQGKKSKINMLLHKYELFKMESNESITKIFTYFSDIINDLKSIGKPYINSELVQKIIKSLFRAWEVKVTVI